MFSRAAALVGIVPTAALAAPSPVMQPPAEKERDFQFAEVRGAGTQISTTMANEFTKEFKKIAVGDPGIDGVRPVFSESKDLTDRARFDRFGYLSQHPDCVEIVGQGITKFELRFRRLLSSTRASGAWISSPTGWTRCIRMCGCTRTHRVGCAMEDSCLRRNSRLSAI